MSEDVKGKIDCSFPRKLYGTLYGIEMLVYGLTLSQDFFELRLVQLVNCWKIRKDE